MRTTMMFAMVVGSAAIAGACAVQDSEPVSEPGVAVERIADGERALEVRSLDSDDAQAYEITYDEAGDVRTAVIQPPFDDPSLNAEAAALLSDLPDDFRQKILASTAANVLGDLLKKMAWVSCVKWCLFVDGEPAALCASACCSEDDLMDICV